MCGQGMQSGGHSLHGCRRSAACALASAATRHELRVGRCDAGQAASVEDVNVVLGQNGRDELVCGAVSDVFL
eukprot:13821285-Heterocapsa_arctica.AAC.2